VNQRLQRAAICSSLLMAAFSLKLGYSHAGAAQLDWVLAPSCWLATQLFGLPLSPEPGAGYISHHPRMVVGAACAGVNFLVVSWLALFFVGRVHLSRSVHVLAWACASLVAAYVATVATNGLRIGLAAELYGAGVRFRGLSPARLHRLLGIVVYCSALVALCRGADVCLSHGRTRAALHVWLAPLGLYLAVALGIPLLNRAWARHGGEFVEHALWTSGVGSLVVFTWWLLGRVTVRLCSRPKAF